MLATPNWFKQTLPWLCCQMLRSFCLIWCSTFTYMREKRWGCVHVTVNTHGKKTVRFKCEMSADVGTLWRRCATFNSGVGDVQPGWKKWVQKSWAYLEFWQCLCCLVWGRYTSYYHMLSPLQMELIHHSMVPFPLCTLKFFWDCSSNKCFLPWNVDFWENIFRNGGQMTDR